MKTVHEEFVGFIDAFTNGNLVINHALMSGVYHKLVACGEIDSNENKGLDTYLSNEIPAKSIVGFSRLGKAMKCLSEYMDEKQIPKGKIFNIYYDCWVTVPEMMKDCGSDKAEQQSAPNHTADTKKGITTVNQLKKMMEDLIADGKGDYQVDLCIFMDSSVGHVDTWDSEIKINDIDEDDEIVTLSGDAI